MTFLFSIKIFRKKFDNNKRPIEKGLHFGLQYFSRTSAEILID